MKPRTLVLALVLATSCTHPTPPAVTPPPRGTVDAVPSPAVTIGPRPWFGTRTATCAATGTSAVASSSTRADGPSSSTTEANQGAIRVTHADRCLGPR